MHILRKGANNSANNVLQVEHRCINAEISKDLDFWRNWQPLVCE